MLRTERYLKNTFNWSVKFCGPFRRIKFSGKTVKEKKQQKTGFLFSRRFSG